MTPEQLKAIQASVQAEFGSQGGTVVERELDAAIDRRMRELNGIKPDASPSEPLPTFTAMYDSILDTGIIGKGHKTHKGMSADDLDAQLAADLNTIYEKQFGVAKPEITGAYLEKIHTDVHNRHTADAAAEYDRTVDTLMRETYGIKTDAEPTGTFLSPSEMRKLHLMTMSGQRGNAYAQERAAEALHLQYQRNFTAADHLPTAEQEAPTAEQTPAGLPNLRRFRSRLVPLSLIGKRQAQQAETETKPGPQSELAALTSAIHGLTAQLAKNATPLDINDAFIESVAAAVAHKLKGPDNAQPQAPEGSNTFNQHASLNTTADTILTPPSAPAPQRAASTLRTGYAADGTVRMRYQVKLQQPSSYKTIDSEAKPATVMINMDALPNWAAKRRAELAQNALVLEPFNGHGFNPEYFGGALTLRAQRAAGIPQGTIHIPPASRPAAPPATVVNTGSPAARPAQPARAPLPPVPPVARVTPDNEATATGPDVIITRGPRPAAPQPTPAAVANGTGQTTNSKAAANTIFEEEDDLDIPALTPPAPARRDRRARNVLKDVRPQQPEPAQPAPKTGLIQRAQGLLGGIDLFKGKPLTARKPTAGKSRPPINLDALDAEVAPDEHQAPVTKPQAEPAATAAPEFAMSWIEVDPRTGREIETLIQSPVQPDTSDKQRELEAGLARMTTDPAFARRVRNDVNANAAPAASAPEEAPVALPAFIPSRRPWDQLEAGWSDLPDASRTAPDNRGADRDGAFDPFGDGKTSYGPSEPKLVIPRSDKWLADNHANVSETDPEAASAPEPAARLMQYGDGWAFEPVVREQEPARSPARGRMDSRVDARDRHDDDDDLGSPPPIKTASQAPLQSRATATVARVTGADKRLVEQRWTTLAEDDNGLLHTFAGNMAGGIHRAIDFVHNLGGPARTNRTASPKGIVEPS